MSAAHFDCVVVGGGPVGLTAAAALAKLGFNTALTSTGPLVSQHSDDHCGDAPREADTRTAALFPPSINLLQNLGVWSDLASACEPLLAIRLVDSTGGLLRSPEVTFRAEEIGLPNFGYNIPQAALARALARAVRAAGVSVIADGRVTAVRPGQGLALAELQGERALEASVIIGADGRKSLTREAASITVGTWSYRQAAIACSFQHTRPHRGISTEVYGPAGPCTTVPLPGLASSLVWMERPDEVERLISLNESEFLAALGERLGGMLGRLSGLGPRRTFPMSSLVASSMGRNRIALAGEAGHALPPIGAQGLNLGLSDVAVLADVLADARSRNKDIGSAGVLSAYDRARSGDVRRRIEAVDLLNTSVESGLVPLHLARGLGLHVLAASAPLRKSLMMQGLYPPAPIPRLMRGTDASASRPSAALV